MTELNTRIEAFIELGKGLQEMPDHEKSHVFHSARYHNQWFTAENMEMALSGLVFMLQENQIKKWIEKYEINNSNPKKVGVIMAGNIPAVGFHDAMCVILSGNTLHAKLSSDDTFFMKYLLDKLVQSNPALKEQIVYVDRLNDVDALIATGSDNSARYFEYYFSKKPHIIRKNRTSIAILDGKETDTDLGNLGKDIFTYFGLGCRNISKVYVPENYKFDTFFVAIFGFANIINTQKYANNYDYHRAIFLMNQEQFLDNNFLLIKESKELVSPVGVLYYERYSNTDQLLDAINTNKEKIQCICVREPRGSEVKFGNAQTPNVWDYADGVDTLQFLTNL